ncbi:hypothetical protein [Pusillimonas sp.]|uniref:hypothetical protein n=1 Tax=Pusillimonas sp. TaxID=3040095 RepID=UPI002D7E2F16|nr:hypothetical protein [Pusillimonas sp.]
MFIVALDARCDAASAYRQTSLRCHVCYEMPDLIVAMSLISAHPPIDLLDPLVLPLSAMSGEQNACRPYADMNKSIGTPAFRRQAAGKAV